MISRAVKHFYILHPDLDSLPMGAITISQGVFPLTALAHVVPIQSTSVMVYAFLPLSMPTLYVTMERDHIMLPCAKDNARRMRTNGTRAAVTTTTTRSITATSLSATIDGLPLNASRALVAALFSVGMVSSRTGGPLLLSPRQCEQEWMAAVQPVFERFAISGAAGRLMPPGESALYEELNAAWAFHEIVYTPLLMRWIRSGGRASVGATERTGGAADDDDEASAIACARGRTHWAVDQ